MLKPRSVKSSTLQPRSTLRERIFQRIEHDFSFSLRNHRCSIPSNRTRFRRGRVLEKLSHRRKKTHSCALVGRFPDCCFCDQPRGLREKRQIRKGGREGREEGGLKLNEDALNRELPWKLATMPTWGIKNKLLSPEEHPPRCVSNLRERCSS